MRALWIIWKRTREREREGKIDKTACTTDIYLRFRCAPFAIDLTRLELRFASQEAAAAEEAAAAAEEEQNVWHADVFALLSGESAMPRLARREILKTMHD